MTNINYLQDFLKLIDDNTKKWLKDLSQYNPPKILLEGLDYVLNNDGKKNRPLLMAGIAQLFELDLSKILGCAMAVEFIHNYSLVHDDLPAMDNSPMRRGQESCWVKFNQAQAILIGDCLLNCAFDFIADDKFARDDIKLNLIKMLSFAGGAVGMIGGQSLDISGDYKGNLQSTICMQTLKTGRLLQFCCTAPAILKGQNGCVSDLNLLGEKIGLIYQITDDIIDFEGCPEKVGKPVSTDHEKETILKVLGYNNTKKMVEKLHGECMEIIAKLDKHLSANNIKTDNSFLMNFIVNLGTREK